MANKGGPKKAAYDKAYNARPEEVKKRTMRNAAARAADCPAGQEANHKKPLRKGGSNAKSNVECVPARKNEGWRKGKKGYDK